MFFRTKYIALFALLLGIGVLGSSGAVAHMVLTKVESTTAAVQFAVAQESYGVHTQTPERSAEVRAAFVQKVREALETQIPLNTEQALDNQTQDSEPEEQIPEELPKVTETSQPPLLPPSPTTTEDAYEIPTP